MKRLFCVVYFSSLFSFSFAQTDSATLVTNIRTEANSMLQSFKNKDFSSFVRYNNANLVEMMGGANQFAAYLKQEMDAMKNVEFSEMKAGAVIQLVTRTKPMQCLVEQFSELIINGQPVSSVSHLVGVSTDGGKSWRFADANTGTTEEIKTIIPELSPLIRIPKKKQETGVHLAAMLKTYRPEY